MASTSALLSSAASTRDSIANYQDKIMAIDYANSAYTDDAFNTYSDYLNRRINELTTAGGLSNLSKAATLSETLRSATHSNVSATIQRENNQVLFGDAPLQDKADVIASQYERALSIGDMTLAQTLEGQYYSVSQSIQQQQVEAEKAQESLNKANENAIKSGYTDAIGQIKSGISDALALIHSGTSPEEALGEVSKNLDSTLKTLTGKGLPKGSQANIGSILQGYFSAEFAYNQQASQALRPYDPEAADAFAKYDANGNLVGGGAYSIMANSAYINVPGLGHINAQDASNFAQSPGLIGVSEKNGQVSFYRNQITGFAPNGVPISDQNDVLRLAQGANSGDELKQLEKLGFVNVTKNKDGTISASFSENTDKWIGFNGKNTDLLSNSMGTGHKVTLIPQKNGGFQFLHNNKVMNIAFDGRGLGGLFETSLNGKNVMNLPVAGQHGFNNKINTLLMNANLDSVKQQQSNMETDAANTKLQATLTAAKFPTASLYGTVTPESHNAQFLPAVVNAKPAPRGPQMTQRNGGGFNFTDANGKAISAATYAQQTHQAFRTLLQNMANQGDLGARTALGFVGNDFGYDPRKVSAGSSQANLYNNLVWGTGRSAPTTAPNVQSGKLTLPSGFQL